MNKINSAVWVQKANRYGIDLSEILYQDKRGIYEALDKLELPRTKTLIFDAKEYKNHEKKVKEFINKYKPVFSRLNPLKGGERPYNLNIQCLSDFYKFVETSDVKLEDYEIHLVEKGIQEYGGVIIKGERIIAELVKGPLVNLTQGWKTPLCVTFSNEKKRFIFSNDDDFNEAEKRLLLKAIKTTKDHIGYFEFYFVKDRLLFSNYQEKGGFTKI